MEAIVYLGKELLLSSISSGRDWCLFPISVGRGAATDLWSLILDASVLGRWYQEAGEAAGVFAGRSVMFVCH